MHTPGQLETCPRSKILAKTLHLSLALLEVTIQNLQCLTLACFRVFDFIYVSLVEPRLRIFFHDPFFLSPRCLNINIYNSNTYYVLCTTRGTTWTTQQFYQALKYWSVTDIVQPFREMVRWNHWTFRPT